MSMHLSLHVHHTMERFLLGLFICDTPRHQRTSPASSHRRDSVLNIKPGVICLIFPMTFVRNAGHPPYALEVANFLAALRNVERL
jgi:hypothetical protein